MTAEAILSALGQVDEAYIEEAAPAARPIKKHRKVRWMAAAACLVVAVGIGAFLGSGVMIPEDVAHSSAPSDIAHDPTQEDIVLSDASRGVTVRYTGQAPTVSVNADLMPLTEEELFHYPLWERAAFRGTITGLSNIEIDFQNYKQYRAIALIRVDKVYLGDVPEGETVKVLLPSPVSLSGFWAEDSGTVSAMRTGMTGIFTPSVYDDDAYMGSNDGILMLKDLADYGLGDGERFAFLETEDGLVFARWAYRGAADAQSLDEIEDYVIRMIEKTYP